MPVFYADNQETSMFVLWLTLGSCRTAGPGSMTDMSLCPHPSGALGTHRQFRAGDGEPFACGSVNGSSVKGENFSKITCAPWQSRKQPQKEPGLSEFIQLPEPHAAFRSQVHPARPTARLRGDTVPYNGRFSSLMWRPCIHKHMLV